MLATLSSNEENCAVPLTFIGIVFAEFSTFLRAVAFFTVSAFSTVTSLLIRFVPGKYLICMSPQSTAIANGDKKKTKAPKSNFITPPFFKRIEADAHTVNGGLR